MLRITVHDNPRSLTFQLEGSLAGPWVRELEECWQGTLARRRKPILRVDLTGVTFIDAAGKACLAALHRQGAEFIAADCLMKAVVAEITQPQSERPKMRATDMNDTHDPVRDQDDRLKNFAAELTSAVYPLVLRCGPKDSWITVELTLWRARGGNRREVGLGAARRASREFDAWREGFLEALTERGFSIALANGIEGPLLELELGLHRTFRLVMRRRSRVR